MKLGNVKFSHEDVKEYNQDYTFSDDPKLITLIYPFIEIKYNILEDAIYRIDLIEDGWSVDYLMP